jgi:hypothetical protein
MNQTQTITFLLFLIIIIWVLAWYFFTSWLSRDVKRVKEEIVEARMERRGTILMEEGRTLGGKGNNGGVKNGGGKEGGKNGRSKGKKGSKTGSGSGSGNGAWK